MFALSPDQMGPSLSHLIAWQKTFLSSGFPKDISTTRIDVVWNGHE